MAALTAGLIIRQFETLFSLEQNVAWSVCMGCTDECAFSFGRGPLLWLGKPGSSMPFFVLFVCAAWSWHCFQGAVENPPTT